MDDVFDRRVGESARHRFPVEQPESRDFNLWQMTVNLLCREEKLLQGVGKCLAEPHFDWQWSAARERTTLYRQRLDGGEDTTDVFHLAEERVRTRLGDGCTSGITWCKE